MKGLFMAYDFKNDPNLKATKDGMYSSQWRATGWGVATMALAGVTFLFPPIMIVTLPAALYTGYKAFQANIDVRAGQADIDAQRNAARIAEAMAKVQPPSQSQSQGTDMEWQKRIMAAQAAAAASQNTGRTA
jgi:hypothetical protein